PSLVSDRYVQLTPAYTGGAEMASGTVVKKTASPVELDDLYASVNKLTTQLGPNGANKNGSVSQLLDTLRTYFACGTNLARTKDELHIHVNTVVQRLERIESLLGPGWNSPDRALELQLALRLRSLTENR
ncbi:helix-turn-helix domain-containing protein, partial [Kibdelosporangium lantanae]